MVELLEGSTHRQHLIKIMCPEVVLIDSTGVESNERCQNPPLGVLGSA